MTTKKENRKAWVDELRSGRRKQTTGALQSEGSFCCLGVLCELTPGVSTSSVYTGCNVFYVQDAMNGEVPNDKMYEDLPPPRAMEWVGLVENVGGFKVDEKTKEILAKNGLDFDVGAPLNLVDLNDDGFTTFDVIADIIESEPPGLFQDGE